MNKVVLSHGCISHLSWNQSSRLSYNFVILLLDALLDQ
jgi:hypothetical protein